MAVINQKLSGKLELTTSADNSIGYVAQDGIPYKQTKANFLKEDRQRITSLEENQYSGVIVVQLFADLPVTGVENVSYKVANDPDSNLLGFWAWTGATYVKDATLSPLIGYDLIFSTSDFDNLVTTGTPNANWLFINDVTLGANKTLPDNITLTFNGGVVSGAFTITGVNTKIDAGIEKIFNNDVVLAGTWNVQKIQSSWFGAVSDGDSTLFTGTDNHDVLLKAINFASAQNSTLIIHGKYATEPIEIVGDNFTIDFTPIAEIIGFDNVITPPDSQRLFWLNGCNDVILNNPTFIAPQTFVSGEDRHNLTISGGSNITINELKSTGGGGDGLYIFGTPENVIINRPHCDANRRNGISLISGVGVIINDPFCENISGTNPAAGIDIEPNGLAGEKLEGIKIINPVTKNCDGFGVDIAMPLYGKIAGRLCDVVIENHTSIEDGNNWAGIKVGGVRFTGGGVSTPTWDFPVKGLIKYSGTIVRPQKDGVQIYDWHEENAPKLDIKATVIDCNQANLAGYHAFFDNAGGISAATCYHESKLTVPINDFNIGNFNLDLEVFDTRTPSQTKNAFGIQTGSDSTTTYPKNARIKIRGDYNFLSNNYPINQGYNTVSLQKKKSDYQFSYPDGHIIETSVLLGGDDLRKMVGATIHITAAVVMYLPSISLLLGQELTFVNKSTGIPALEADGTDKILIQRDNQTERFGLSFKNDEITIKATPEGWVRVSGITDKRITGLSSGSEYNRDQLTLKAAPIDGTWTWGAIIWNAEPTLYTNAGWICITAGTPGTWEPFGKLRVQSYSVAFLPSGVLGDRAIVNNALAPIYLAAVVGGGAVICPVWYNGTIWVCA